MLPPWALAKLLLQCYVHMYSQYARVLPRYVINPSSSCPALTPRLIFNRFKSNRNHMYMKDPSCSVHAKLLFGASSQVAVNLLGGIVALGSLKKFSSNQVLDALLDQRQIGPEAASEDIDNLGNKKVVCKLLSGPM